MSDWMSKIQIFEEPYLENREPYHDGFGISWKVFKLPFKRYLNEMSSSSNKKVIQEKPVSP